MDWMWREVRYALRGLRNQPGFTALAVLTLGLGIGASTTIFSVIQNVLLDPFPYVGADRVVAIQIRPAERADQPGRSMFPTPEFLDYQRQSTVFEDVIAGGFERVLYTTRDGTEQFTGGLVSGNMFQFLGVPAVVGRALTPDDAKPGAPPVFVMSYRMWRKFFELDTGIIGQSFVLNGTPTTLVGIMPPRFTKLDADIYRAVTLDPAVPEIRGRNFMFQARLKPGVTREQAESEISVLAQRIAKNFPRNYPDKFVARVVSWVDNVVGPFRLTLYIMASAVGLLLLIACSNVANMLLARGAAREKEVAVRAALGASRAALVRQLLVESLVLALLGAVVGCIFAYFGLKAVVGAIPDGAIPKEAVIRLNGPVLVFSLAIALVTSLVFGLLPAFLTARTDLVESLKDSAKGGSGASRGGWLRNALVVAEVVFSLVLLVFSGLLIRSFVKLQTVDLGFEPERIVFAQVPMPRGQYKTATQKQQFFRPLVTRLQNLPGVVAAATSVSLPPFGAIGSDLDIPGKSHTETWRAIIELCSENWFKTLGVNLLRGRLFDEAEVIDARHVAVINQTLATRFFGTEDPIGKQIQLERLERESDVGTGNATFEIIGIVSDLRNQGLQDPVEPEVCVPFTVTGSFERAVILRTNGDPTALVNSVRREIWAQDRGVAVTYLDSAINLLRQFEYAGPRFSLIVLTAFASVGLVLVALGVYSVIAYNVARQTHEIGIRMALGATRGNVLGFVVKRGALLVGIGIVIGIGVSLLASGLFWRAFASELRDLRPYDPVTLAGVVAVIILAGLAACFFPAWRATRVDPMIALRGE